jgi:hypothetical protein
MPTKTELPLSAVKVEEVLQHREVDPKVVTHYCDLMRDGVQFPPISAVTDGKNIWVWDGFHRVDCHRRLKIKKIQAEVTKGGLRDAVWLSYSANKDHGLRRPPGVAKKIITSILTDKAWAKKSLSEIGRHVGISRAYVMKVRNDLLEAEKKAKAEAKNKGATKGAGATVAPSEKPASETVKRDSKVEVARKTGETVTQPSQEKQLKPISDVPGHEIPEKLRDRWERRAIIQGYISDLQKISKAVAAHLESKDGVMDMLNETAFKAEYGNLRRLLKAAQPYVLCPYCGGKASRCKACKKRGFLNEYDYRTVPEELKK